MSYPNILGPSIEVHMAGRVKVTGETSTGRNTKFQDTKTGREMTRPVFVKEIERGNYDNYHVRNVDGVKTPCSNPDKSEKNNLD